MQSSINIIGNDSSVIFYNLNKQFSNINKIIITKEIILNSFEDEQIRNLFAKLKVANSDEYKEILSNAKKNQIFDSPFISELYSSIQEQLPKISESLRDVQLKDFNFMNSLSNTNLTVTLRCENFSISKYNIEKGSILSAIRHLLESYLDNPSNILRLSRLDSIQIEIYESEEIHKKVLLKKDHETLQLYSTFGYSNFNPIDYQAGGEIYFSIGDDFSFFQNKQTKALVKEHGKIVEREINQREKILNNNELIAINEITKNINDALIEIYISSKGGIKILNVSLLETGLSNKSENGFILHKSTNNIDTISTVTLRDNLNEELPNPKYLIIKNEDEIKEFLENINYSTKVDGIIFTENFYSEILDLIGSKLNIDILYFNKNVPKIIETKIDLDNVNIEIKDSKQNTTNPFASIIGEQEKEKDIELERLKNIDLSTPQKEINNQLNQNIENIAQGIMSSNNSTINDNRKMNNNQNNRNSIASSLNSTLGSTKPGEKKSALAFMMEVAANEPSREEKEAAKQQNQMQAQNQYQQNNNNNIQNQYQQQNLNQNQINKSFNNLNNQEQNQNQITKINEENINIQRYNQTLATKILTVPNVQSNNYFVDINTISMVTGGEIFYLTTDLNEMGNPNMKYILPLELYQENSNPNYLLINSTNEYFLLNEKTKTKNIFLNLSRIDGAIKKQFLDHAIKEIGKVSLIILKENLYLLEKHINKIENIMVKDIQSELEYQEIKNQILGFEKKFLMNKF